MHILSMGAERSAGEGIIGPLTAGGYWVTTLDDPRQARGVLARDVVDLILLDVMLPYIDGFTLCATLRREHPEIPVIIVSAGATPSDRVAGLNHGADDYITWPIDPAVLLARIAAVLRRSKMAAHDTAGRVITVGDAALDLRAARFTVPCRHPAQLTPTEMRILACLMRNANAVIPRGRLIDQTWGDEHGGSNRVDVYIGRLRKKIESGTDDPPLIETVRGGGYVFRGPADQCGGAAAAGDIPGASRR